MELARLTEQIIEYLIISSALLFLLGMLSLFAVQLFKVKGKTKIWIFAFVFILPVIYPARSFLPESIRIPLALQSDYLKPLSIISRGTPVSAGKPILPITHESKGKFTKSKIIDTKIVAPILGLRERALDTASMLFTNWKLVTAILWMIIFSIFLSRLIAATRAIKRLLRLSTPVNDQRIIGLLRQCASETRLPYVPPLYEVQGISTPMAMGFLKPVIIIPSHLITAKSIEGLRFTLLHELKHIDQRHNLWLFIESIIGAVYFFHPVIPWAKRKIHEEMEHICDGHVIKVTHKSITYADFLLNEIWQNSPSRYSAFSLPFISSSSKTADRIRLILENRVASASMPAREVVVVISIFILFSSFIFFTGVTMVKVPNPISSFENWDRETDPKQIEHTVNIKASSVTTPLTSPVKNKARIHEAVISQMNAEITNKREYATESLYEKSGTVSVKQTTSTANNKDMGKRLPAMEVFSEQPENLTVKKSDASVNFSQATDTPVTETIADTLPSPVETTAKKYLGAPVKELTIHRIDNIKVLDQYTILFIMHGGDMYLTRLPDPCPALLYTNDFNLPSITGRISKFDRIQAISNNRVLGTTAMLGEFYPYRYEGSKGKAIKLLKKLISEGVLNVLL